MVSSSRVRQQLVSRPALYAYWVLGGALTGFLLTYFVFVPMMRNACCLFNARCSSVLVSVGPGNTILVQQPSTGYTYYFDGTRIFSYGMGVSGTCPHTILGPTTTTEGNKACAAVDVNGKCLPPCLDPDVPADVTTDADGNPVYTCNGTPSTEACCRLPGACPSTTPVCRRWAAAMPHDTYACDDRTVEKNTCCDCAAVDAPDPVSVASAEVLAQGTILQPSIVLDAKTMTVLPDMIYCGKHLQLLLGSDFKNVQVKRVNVNSPSRELNIYQIFDVLKQKKIFKP